MPSETKKSNSALRENFSVCKKCGRPVAEKDKCACRLWLCYKCCECGLDCDNCSCSHKR